MWLILKKGRTLFSGLPEKVPIQLGDKGYDCKAFFIQLWEKGKLFISPLKQGKGKRGIDLIRKIAYKKLYKLGVYQSRSTSVEPFIGRIKSLFGLDPLPDKGKKKAHLLILGSVLAYQLIVLYNAKTHRKLGAVKEVLEGL